MDTTFAGTSFHFPLAPGQLWDHVEVHQAVVPLLSHPSGGDIYHHASSTIHISVRTPARGSLLQTGYVWAEGKDLAGSMNHWDFYLPREGW